jgi:hypothetical protein
MADEFSGEFPTVTPKRAWAAARADGIRALVFEGPEGALIAFDLTAEQCRYLSGELAKLAALPLPPKTPNA